MASPHFVDMIGWPVEGHKVLERAESLDGEARWRCLHRCGAEVVVLGSVLRTSPPAYCAACIPENVRRKVRPAPHLCGCSARRPCPTARRLFRDGRTRALTGHLRRSLREDA